MSVAEIRCPFAPTKASCERVVLCGLECASRCEPSPHRLLPEATTAPPTASFVTTPPPTSAPMPVPPPAPALAPPTAVLAAVPVAAIPAPPVPWLPRQHRRRSLLRCSPRRPRVPLHGRGSRRESRAGQHRQHCPSDWRCAPTASWKSRQPTHNFRCRAMDRAEVRRHGHRELFANVLAGRAQRVAVGDQALRAW